MAEIRLPKHPIQVPVSTWNNAYPLVFKYLFEDAYIDPLLIHLSPLSEALSIEPAVGLYYYFLSKQYNRVVLPYFRGTDESNTLSINGMKAIISVRSYGLKYKYDMLADTMPENLDELYYNYYMAREYEKTVDPDEGTITHSGNDTTFTNTNRQTKSYSTTGENQTPRLKEQTDTFTVPQGSTDQAGNSIKTTYGHTITTAPGDEVTTFSQTAHGYYNSGSKAKMIEDIRNLLSLNLLDQWIYDIMPIFCLDKYDTKAPMYSDFVNL